MGDNKRSVKIQGGGTVAFERQVFTLLNKLIHRQQYALLDSPACANGSTTGKAKTTRAAAYRVAGQVYYKAGTDDLWDFTSETDVAASAYAAYALYLNAAGTASILKHGSADTTTAAAAITALRKLVDAEDAKCLIGVFVTDGTAKNWDGEALASGGTFYDGMPEAQEVEELISSA